MPPKAPNGKKPGGSGAKDVKDAEMKDNASITKKGKSTKKVVSAKEADEEMTVVVPPKKGPNSKKQPLADADGDVDMDASPDKADEAGENGAIVDPIAQTISGKFANASTHARCQAQVSDDSLHSRNQEQFLPP